MTKALLSLTLGGVLMVAGALPMAAQNPSDQAGDKSFASLDADRDGKLTTAEFGKMYEKDGKAATDQEKQNEFRAWDTDGDGSVSKAEFDAKHSAAQPHLERIEQPEQAEPPKQ